MEDFTPLSSQPALGYLYLYDCKNLKNIDALHPLASLKGLTLKAASLPTGTLSEIVRAWPGLDMLQLVEADWVTDLAPITALPLEVLTMSACPRLTDITPVAHLSRLTWLSVSETPFSDLTPISSLSGLNTLRLGGRDQLLDLAPASRLPKLRRLFLHDVPEDTDLSPLAKSRNLTIVLNEGQRVQGTDGLHRSTRIEWEYRD